MHFPCVLYFPVFCTSQYFELLYRLSQKRDWFSITIGRIQHCYYIVILANLLGVFTLRKSYEFFKPLYWLSCQLKVVQCFNSKLKFKFRLASSRDPWKWSTHPHLQTPIIEADLLAGATLGVSNLFFLTNNGMPFCWLIVDCWLIVEINPWFPRLEMSMEMLLLLVLLVFHADLCSTGVCSGSK